MAPKTLEDILKDQNCTELDLPIIPKNSPEEWRDVPGYPCFQASNLGRIRSVRTRIINPCKTRLDSLRKVDENGVPDDQGYLVVSIGNRKKVVHRMVAAAFLGREIPEDLIVHHRDNDKINNELSNLEITTKSQNTLYAYADGRIGSQYILNPFQRRKVVELYKSGEYLTIHLAKMFNVSKATIINLLNQAGCPLHHFKFLTPMNRAEIKRLYGAGGISMREIGIKFSVTTATIENVLADRPGGRRKKKLKPRKKTKDRNAVSEFFPGSN